MEMRTYFIGHLDSAIAEGQIQVRYQPVVRSTTGKVCAVEALSRWEIPGKGLYYPKDFIPALEEAGLTRRLDLFVVDRILEKLCFLKQSGRDLVCHSFNLSQRELFEYDIAEEIRSRVDAAGIPRELLAIEIEERVVEGDFEKMHAQFERFHELGFRVWLDNFGTSFLSQNIFRRNSIDLVKFDLKLFRQFASPEAGRIVLSELMKMTIGLGIDSICEGVETEEEERFLREIGCEKLQGYYFGRAKPFEEIGKLIREDSGIPAEDPQETVYYDRIGRINLYDLAVLARKDPGSFNGFFNTIPMAIVEIRRKEVEFVRSNQTYREFVRDVIGYDVSGSHAVFTLFDEAYQTDFLKQVLRCCREKDQAYVTERLPNRMTVRSFVRWLSDNPKTGGCAAVVAVLSVSDAEQEDTYENIARALAADYFTLFYVDLDTGGFIEYNAKTGKEKLAIERRGSDFFDTIRKDAKQKIVEDDLENFIFSFTEQNILRSLEAQGSFTMTFRMYIRKEPVKVSLKARRMQPGDSHLIIGISIIDEQARLEEGYERKVIADMLQGSEAAGMEGLSLYAASFAVKSCVKLMGSGDFRENVRAVLKDLMELSQADSARVMLINKERKTVSMFAEINRPGCFPDREAQLAALKYEVIADWEKLIGKNNAIIVENETDREELREKNPAWYERMKHDGTQSHVLVPLRQKGDFLGYLYVLNHDTRRTEKIRELIELVSYFLSSEISNYQFRRELEILSNFDQLTGLKNRHSMIRRIEMLENGPRCSFGVLTMDLNGLKTVNDTEGHMAGDELIRNAALMLKEEFGAEELYRIGGDEFIVIFPEISEEVYREAVDRFLTGRLKASGISMACGTFWSAGNENTQTAFFNADQNMYADKKAFYAKQGKQNT